MAWLHLVLVAPEIPGNTGNIIRLCANTGAQLHLVEPLGFALDDKRLRRAGLDYHEYATLAVHRDWSALRAALPTPESRIFLCSRHATQDVYAQRFAPGDALVMGPETSGLPPALRDSLPAQQQLRLPMVPGSRSLNLANASAVLCYEAWRQCGFPGALQ